MELKQIVRRAVRRWAEKIASKRAQRQARLALPSGSDLSERKAGRLGVAGSVAGHIGEITVAESRPESFTRPTSPEGGSPRRERQRACPPRPPVGRFRGRALRPAPQPADGAGGIPPQGTGCGCFPPPHGTRPQLPLPRRPRGGHPLLGPRCVALRGFRPPA